MVWGHDGTSSSWGTPVPSTLLQRLLRVWRVQETGTVGNVVVRIPRAVLGVQNPRLLRSVDPTFDGGDTQVPMTRQRDLPRGDDRLRDRRLLHFASESAPAPLNAGDGLVTEGHIKGMVLNSPVCAAYPWQHAPRTTSGLTGGLTGSPVGTATAAESTWVGDVTRGRRRRPGARARERRHRRLAGQRRRHLRDDRDHDVDHQPASPSVTARTETTFLGDVNGDAAIDLISVTDGGGVSANSGTRVWLGNGDGTFDPVPVADLGAFSGTVAGVANIIQAGYSANETTLLADVTGDGRMDLVWVTRRSGTAANSGVWTWAGNGDGTFNHTPIVDTGFTGAFPVGGSNIVQAGANGKRVAARRRLQRRRPRRPAVDLRRRRDAGQFGHVVLGRQWQRHLQPHAGGRSGLLHGRPERRGGDPGGERRNQVTRTADVNNDGRLDVVWANGPAPNGVWVWMGAGNGTFAHTPIADSGGFLSFDAGVSATEDNFIIDLNGDGALDFVSLSDTGATARSYLAVDTDGDGIGDLVDTDDDNDGIPDAADSCPVPGSIGTGLQLWLKADAGTTVDSSNNFLHWADQSPFARDANVAHRRSAEGERGGQLQPDGALRRRRLLPVRQEPVRHGFTAGEVFTVTKSTTPAGVSTTNPYDLGSGSRAEHYVFNNDNDL